MADTNDLGPVTYEWKEGEGNWAMGVVLKAMESSCEKFSCRLKNPHLDGEGEASEAVDNPCCPPPGMCPVDGSNMKGHIT